MRLGMKVIGKAKGIHNGEWILPSEFASDVEGCRS